MQYTIIWTSEIQCMWIAKVDNNFVHGLCFVYHILSNWFADVTFCFHKTHLYVQNTCIKIFFKKLLQTTKLNCQKSNIIQKQSEKCNNQDNVNPGKLSGGYKYGSLYSHYLTCFPNTILGL
jgi:hypothetical protein